MSGKHFNRLTPAEAEALALLAEECAEVQHIICKTLRHGLWSTHPDNPGISNHDELQKEVGDLMAAVRIAEVQKLIEWRRVISNRDAKMNRVERFLHHAKVWPAEGECE
jgi:hypothetical protein